MDIQGGQTMTENVFTVPEQRVPWLHKKLTGLNRKADKLGSPHVSMIIVGDGEPIKRYRCETRDMIGHDHSHCIPDIYPTKVLRVEGEAPVLNGWAFAAILQHLSDDEGQNQNIVRIVPGFEEALPVEYRTADSGNCDHCHTYRRRNDTYVVRNVETGEYKQVGSNCLRDFLGHTSPELYARFAEALETFFSYVGADDVEIDYTADSHLWQIEDFLTLTAARIRKDGWVSKKVAREDPYGKPATANVVVNQLTDKASDADWYVTPNDADVEIAEAALEWARDIDPNTVNDYLYNVRVIASQRFVGWRTSGIAASIIAAYRRATEGERKRQERRESNYVGAVGDKVTVEGLVVFTDHYASDYGSTQLIKVETDEGNVVTWWSSNDQDVTQGQTRIKLTGKVKKLEEYRGQKTTVLTRCKLAVVTNVS